MAESSTRQVEDVHGSGIYPATGPFPKGAAVVRSHGRGTRLSPLDGVPSFHRERHSMSRREMR